MLKKMMKLSVCTSVIIPGTGFLVVLRPVVTLRNKLGFRNQAPGGRG